MGLDLGLETAGRLIGESYGPIHAAFRVRACIEANPACRETIISNRNAGRTKCKRLKVFGGIREVRDPQAILKESNIAEPLPLLIGGPPCKSFSTVGKRRTVNDPNGALLWEFVRFVDRLRPKFFVLENVRGLLSAPITHRPLSKRGPNYPPLSRNEKPGSVYRKLLGKFERLGYHVDTFEVNAVNYGAPQLRERVLLIGNKYNLQVDFPPPRYHSSSISSDNKFRSFRTLCDAIGDVHETNPVILDFSPRQKRYLSMVPPGGNWRSLPRSIFAHSMGLASKAKGGRSGWWRKLVWNLPSPCLVTQPRHTGTCLCHPDSVRALSVKEYSLIQEFPRRWKICGTPEQRYSQLGNAVPLRLSEIIGKIVGDGLIKAANMRETTRRNRVLPSRRIYLQSHVRTRIWHLGGRGVVLGKGNVFLARRRPSTIPSNWRRTSKLRLTAPGSLMVTSVRYACRRDSKGTTW